MVHDVATRRAVHNAILTGDDPHALGLPEHVVSWHIIWLAHAGLIYLVTDRRYIAIGNERAAA